MKISNVIVRLCEEFISLPNSLGITRDKMPQIPADKLEAFLKYLKTDAGCDYERISLPASQLTPSQNELDTDKADKIWNDGNAFDHVIIISADKYILDGHHRWFAVKRNAPEEEMNCIMLGYNAKPCLEIMLNFDQVEKENLKGEIVEAVDRGYGFCPICGAAGGKRERRPNGNDACDNDHTYPSKKAVKAKITESYLRQHNQNKV